MPKGRAERPPWRAAAEGDPPDMVQRAAALSIFVLASSGMPALLAAALARRMAGGRGGGLYAGSFCSRAAHHRAVGH